MLGTAQRPDLVKSKPRPQIGGGSSVQVVFKRDQNLDLQHHQAFNLLR